MAGEAAAVSDQVRDRSKAGDAARTFEPHDEPASSGFPQLVVAAELKLPPDRLLGVLVRAYRRADNVGSVYRAMQRRADAERALEEAREIGRNLAEVNPGDPSYLARTLTELGQVYSATQRPAEAEQAYIEARDTYRKLAEVNPDLYLSAVVSTLVNLGDLYRATQRLADAEQAYIEAAQTLSDRRVFLSGSGRTAEAEGVGVTRRQLLRRLDDMKHASAGTPAPQ